MNPDIIRGLTDTNDWMAIWPEISVACLALALILFHVLLPVSSRRYLPGLAIAAQLILLLILARQLFTIDDVQNHIYFGGMIQQTFVTHGARVFFLASSIVICCFSTVYLAKYDLPKVEYSHIVLIVTAAMMLLVQSHHFVMLFVALETVTVGFYVLVSYNRESAYSLEAGMKYLILGALSSSILLFGIVLLYGVAGTPALLGSTTDSMNFTALNAFLSANPGHPIALVGIIMVVCGIAFKIGVVPFQIWIPDVYQGAPTPTTAFLAVSSKAAGFIVLLNLVKFAFPISVNNSLLIPMFSAIAIISILFGNLAALSQHNVKRVMGMSGVAHAGYLLAGVVAIMEGSFFAYSAVLFYLLTYMIASYAVFGVMIHVPCKDDAEQTYEDYVDLAKRSPFLAGVLSVGLGSLAGVPPLVGFIAKFLLFIALYQEGLYSLLGVAILGVIISIYYYFSWIREAVFRIFHFDDGSDTKDEERQPLPELKKSQVLLLGILATLAVMLGFFQGDLASFIF